MLRRMFSSSSDIPEITVDEARRRQAEGAILLDVREPFEWAEGHAPGATHIPLGLLDARAGELPAGRDLLVICRSGNRSARAVQWLRRAGHSGAQNVAGGMIAWAERRLPVVAG